MGLLRGPPGGHREHDDATLLARARTNARRALDAGITTVRDLGQVTPGSSPGETQFGATELGAVVAAARAAGLPVAAHAHGRGGVAAAVAAQVDSIEHCSFMTDVKRVLAMCASLAADALGIERQAGRVRPGLPADRLVVDGLVETDPDAIRRPLLVLRAGVDVRRHH